MSYNSKHDIWMQDSSDPVSLSLCYRKKQFKGCYPRAIFHLYGHTWPKVKGIYMLFDEYSIKPVYIGRSIDIFKRMLQHENKFHFKYYAYIEMDATIDVIEELEYRLIKKYRPKYNKVLLFNKTSQQGNAAQKLWA